MDEVREEEKRKEVESDSWMAMLVQFRRRMCLEKRLSVDRMLRSEVADGGKPRH